MPVLVAIITPKPGQLEEVQAILAEAIPAVHQEPGCELYALHHSRDKVVMVEKWTDAEALATHSKGPALAKLGPRLANLVAAPMELHVLDAVPVGEATKGAL